MTSQPPAPQRMTRQRKAVEEALSKNKGFCSAQDLHATLRAQGNRVGLATVYSQLRGMVDAGMLDVIRSDAGEAMYRRCGAGDHHHHLRCRSCGNVEELHAPAVETWASEVASSSGYRDVSHSLEITGLCPACASG